MAAFWVKFMKIKVPDVYWKVPNKKKAIAMSSKSISDFIVDLAASGGTIAEIYQQSLKSYCYDAQEILAKYIDLGYGGIKAKRFFRRGLYRKKRK